MSDEWIAWADYSPPWRSSASSMTYVDVIEYGRISRPRGIKALYFATPGRSSLPLTTITSTYHKPNMSQNHGSHGSRRQSHGSHDSRRQSHGSHDSPRKSVSMSPPVGGSHNVDPIYRNDDQRTVSLAEVERLSRESGHNLRGYMSNYSSTSRDRIL